MRFLPVFLGFLALAASQGGVFQALTDYFNDNKNDYVIDIVHNYRVEEHDLQNGYHLMIAISDERADMSCHLIEISTQWEYLLNDPDNIHPMSEEIYDLISSGTAVETALEYDDLIDKYGDGDSLKECYRHTVYEMTYTPTFHLQTTMAPTRPA